MKYPAIPAKIISRIGWERMLSADLRGLALFFMNIGAIVKRQVMAKIIQLLPSIKLTEGCPTGFMSRSAAAPIRPKTDTRNMCIVRVK